MPTLLHADASGWSGKYVYIVFINPCAYTMFLSVHSVHAAVLVINEAIDKQIADETLQSLLNPAAMLSKIEEANKERYQDELYQAKRTKEDRSQERVG